MVKVLITNVSILTMSNKHDLFIDCGYVFVKDGVVKAVGRGEVPEDYQYPELLISGRGRLLIPGISSGFTSITSYPLRYLLPHISSREYSEYISVLTRTDVYYVAILALTDLLYKGVTNLVISDIFLDDVARAINDVGLYAVLTVPFNVSFKDFNPQHELKLLTQRWCGRVENVYCGVAAYNELSNDVVNLIKDLNVKAFLVGFKDVNLDDKLKGINPVFVDPYVESVDGLNVIRTYTTIGLWRPFQGVGIGNLYTYDLTDLLKELVSLGFKGFDVLLSATNITSSIIGLSELNAIEEGKKANMVMLNLAEPPGWPLLPSINALVNAVISGRARVESVIVGDNILVDGGEVLSVGSDLIKKATSRIDEVLKELRIKGRLVL